MISNSDAQFFGPKNYLLSPGIETGRQGWSLFNTTLTSKIPTGAITAGAASITTFGSSSTTPLSGDYSLRVASSGAVTAGHGFISDSFTIDRQDRAKVMGWSFSFEAVSGTMDFSGTSANTWAVYIYDVDGAAWIQPAGVYNLTQSSGVGLASGTFQTTATGTQYRIAVVCITATGGAVEMRLDSFQVGPQKVLQGPSGPVGEIIAFGSLTPPVGFLFCDGTAVSRSNYSDLFKAIGTTYGVGDGSTTFNLPDLRGVFARGAGSQTISGVTFTGTLGSKQVDTLQGHKHIGPVGVTGGAPTNPGNNINAQYANGGAGSTQWDGTGNNVYYTDSSNSPGRGPSVGSETRPANVAVAYHIRYLATYQMSSDTDTRVVALTVSKTTTQSITSAGGAQAVVSWASATNDTHASFNSTTGEYTVPVSGFYRVSGNINFASNSTSGRFVFIQLDGVRQYLAGIPAVPSPYDTRVPFAGDVYCIAGQKLRIAVDQTSGGALNIAANPDTSETRLSISRISGPATIAASETCAASYSTAAAPSIPNNSATAVVYPTRVFDTHSMMNTSTGVVTIPVSGLFEVKASHYFGTAIAATATDVQTICRRNGVTVQGTNFTKSGTALGPLVTSGSFLVRCNAGDSIQIFLLQANSAATAQSLLATGDFNWMSINRVGN